MLALLTRVESLKTFRYDGGYKIGTKTAPLTLVEMKPQDISKPPRKYRGRLRAGKWSEKQYELVEKDHRIMKEAYRRETD